MNPVRRIVLLIIVLATGMLAWKQWNGRGTTSPTAVLLLHGNVEIREVDLAFRVGGRISSLAVEEGTPVNAGDLLGRLDPDLFAMEVRRAEAAVRGQQAALEKLEAGFRVEEIAQARAMLLERLATADNLRQSQERIRTLRRTGGVSQQDLEDVQARHTEAVARVDAARKQLALLETGSRVEDIAVQEAALAVAEAQADLARTAWEDTWLLAPQAGIVLTRVQETGAIVQPGQTVFTLSLVDPVYIRAYVPQPRLGLIRPGAPVEISVDAAPDRWYPGVIGFVSPRAEFTPKTVETGEVRNDLVFRLRVIAPDPDKVMRQGMPVTVRLHPAPLQEGRHDADQP